MAVVPLRWQGTARTAQVRAKVEELTRAWMSAWLAGGNGSVAVDNRGQVPRAIGMEMRTVRAGEHRLLASLPPLFLEQLGARLADVHFDGPSGRESIALASGIGRRAFEDWMHTLLATSARVEVGDAAEHAQVPSERHGAVHLECVLQGLRCELYLDASLCDALAPVARGGSVDLRPLREALRTQAVTLDVMLDLGDSALAEALALAPGDIVKTRAPLTSTLQLRTPDGRTIAGGTLAAADAFRAIKISHLQTSGSHP